MTATQVHLLGLLLMQRILLQLNRMDQLSPPVNRAKRKNIMWKWVTVVWKLIRPRKKGRAKNRGGTNKKTVPASRPFQNATKKGTEVLHSVGAGNGQHQVASPSLHLQCGVDAGGSDPQKNRSTTGVPQSAQSKLHAPGVERKLAVETNDAQRGLDQAAERERTRKRLGQEKDKINR